MLLYLALKATEKATEDNICGVALSWTIICQLLYFPTYVHLCKYLI